MDTLGVIDFWRFFVCLFFFCFGSVLFNIFNTMKMKNLNPFGVLCLTLVTVLMFASRAHSTHHSTSNDDSRCEEISIPMCRNIGYNDTSMPNQFHHDTQDEAGLEGKIFFSVFGSLGVEWSGKWSRKIFGDNFFFCWKYF